MEAFRERDNPGPERKVGPNAGYASSKLITTVRETQVPDSFSPTAMLLGQLVSLFQLLG